MKTPIELIKSGVINFADKQQADDFLKRYGHLIKSYTVHDSTKYRFGFYTLSTIAKPIKRCPYCECWKPSKGFARSVKHPNWRARVCADCIYG